MKIDPQWIPLSEQLPEHDTACIVGNVNKRDTSNPLLGSRWEEATATFKDRQKAMDETHEAMASVDPSFNCIMKSPLVGSRLMFQMSVTGLYKEVSEFTHWWPIPKPFTEHPTTQEPGDILRPSFSK